MFKKLCALFLLVSLLSSVSVGCGTSPNTSSGSSVGGDSDQSTKLKVAFIIPGSISDGAFGTISYQGVQAVKDEPYIEKADFIEGVNAATDAAKAARDYVAAGYDVIWAQSGAHGAAVMEVAPQFPDTAFVTLAAPPSDQSFDNVWFSLTECEGAYYISGALAALTTQTNVIGYVGGRENPLYVACAQAYEQGAKSINPDIKVLTAFTGDFNDPIKAKEATASQIESGADIISHLQSLGTTGVFAAAEEAALSGNKVWIIGKDTDQYEQAPDIILTSIILDYGVQMKNILSEIAAGKRSGSMPQDVAGGAVYLADFRGNVSSEVETQIAELTEQIKAGAITYTTQYDIG